MMLLVLGSVTAWSQGLVSLYVMPIARSPELSQPQADLIEDSLVAGLLATGAFTLNARARTAPLVPVTDGIPGAEALAPGVLDDAGALGLAEESGATLVLFSRASMESREGSDRTIGFLFRLVAVDTGKDVHVRSSKLQESTLAAGLEDEARRIATAARARSDVTLDMIDSLIKATDWETARRYLDTFLASRPAQEAVMAARSARINQSLAEKRYVQAREAAALGLYEEALRATAEAVALAPDSAEYQAYQAGLGDEYARYLAQSADERLKIIETFLEQGRLDLAATLLERAGDGARDSARGQMLAAAVDRDQKARAAMLRAEGLFKADQYPEALAAMDEALRLKPDHAVYLRFRIRILEAEKQRAATLERLSAYRAEFEAFDYAGLFYSRKSIPVGWAGILGSGTVRGFDPAVLSWEPKEWGSYPFLELRYSWALPWFINGPFSFTELRTGAQASGGALGGVDRTSSSLAGAALFAEHTGMFWLGGGANTALEFMSIALRLDAGLEFSFLGRSSEHLSSAGDVVSSFDANIFTLGAHLGLNLQWAPSPRFAFSVGLGRTWPVMSNLSVDAGAPTRDALSFGLEMGSLP
jgi:tetratricopeptide (TPR) repeat protein